MQKIIVMGGTGFIGTGILKQLQRAGSPVYELVSISKSGGNVHDHLPNVRYLAADLMQAGAWQREVQSADWLINCIGILFPNPIKKTSYEQNSLLPGLRIIDAIKSSNTKLIFLNMNSAPFFLNNYAKTKNVIAEYAERQLNSRAINIYPGLVYDKSRNNTYYIGKSLNTFVNKIHWDWSDKSRPIPRYQLAEEVEKIINGEASELTHKI